MPAWSAGLDATLRSLPSSIPVALLGPTPISSVDVPRCVAAHLRDPQECTTSRSVAVDTPIIDADRTVTTADHDTFVDAAALVCPTEQCPVIEWNMLMYVDTNHLTTVYARSQAPAIDAAIEPLLR